MIEELDNRGKFLIAEDLRNFSNRKKTNILISHLLLITGLLISAMLIIFNLFDIKPYSDYEILSPVLIIIFPIFTFSLIIFWLGHRKMQFKLFENGFIPYSRPLSYIIKNKELFYKWDDIIKIYNKKPESAIAAPPPKEDDWRYAIVTKDNRGIIVGNYLFEDGGNIVFKKLNEVENELKERGVKMDVIKEPMYETS